ncbi:MAG: YihY/virulence factor BrkB family protein [Myxococcales bacterium]
MRTPGGGSIPLKVLFKRLYEEYENDAVSDSAAALGYYFLFSLFPFLFFLATLTAYLPLGNSVDTLMARLRTMLPTQAMGLIDDHVHALVSRPRAGLLTFGLAITVYSASRGVDALRKAMNLAYDVKETRPFWRTELLAIGMTVGGAIAGVLAITALVAGGYAGFWLAGWMGITSEYVFVWTWLRWPVTAAVIMLAGAINYYVLPDVQQKIKFITPGSVAATLIWLLTTWGFGQYVSHFGSYNVTYGSIGGVIVLMTWFYMSGFIFLMGGEVNAILEQASPEGKRTGARSEGQRPAPPEERPSAMPAGAAGLASVAERSPGGVKQDGSHP